MKPSNSNDKFLEFVPSAMRYKIISYARIKLRSGEFQRASVRDICDDLNISRMTFYCHFRNKHHLMDHLIQVVQKEAIDAMRGMDYPDAISCLVRYIDDNREIFKNLLIKKNTALGTIAFSRILAEIICEQFEKQKNNGRRITFNVNFAAVFITGGIVYILAHWVDDGFKLKREEIEVGLNNVFYKGIPLFA